MAGGACSVGSLMGSVGLEVITHEMGNEVSIDHAAVVDGWHFAQVLLEGGEQRAGVGVRRQGAAEQGGEEDRRVAVADIAEDGAVAEAGVDGGNKRQRHKGPELLLADQLAQPQVVREVAGKALPHQLIDPWRAGAVDDIGAVAGGVEGFGIVEGQAARG